MSKVITTCTVTGVLHTPSMAPHRPVTPEEIIEATVGTAKAAEGVARVRF
jgi:uncharacterized protein (DUF849 family)